MANIDSLRIEFCLVVDNNTEEDILCKPIVVNNKPVGVIVEAELDELGLYFNCKGIIWDRFVGISLVGESKFGSIEISGNLDF